MSKQIEALKMALEALEDGQPDDPYPFSLESKAITAIREALADSALDRMAENARELGLDYEPAQHERVQPDSECKEDDGCPTEKAVLQRFWRKAQQHQCSRSHPHENMDAMCELRTEIARLTNENARLKARHQDDEINAYRMTLLCIRDGLQQGMSKSIQKLQAREINDVLGLPSFASYRTSPPAQRKPLTDAQIGAVAADIWGSVLIAPQSYQKFARAIEAKLKERNT